MPWTAPPVRRQDPDSTASERDTLVAFLEFHRQTFLWKCSGLSGEQLARRAVPPSTMSLLGLVRHLADVERVWFRVRLSGEDVPMRFWTDDHPDADFDDVDPAGAENDYRALLDEMEQARVRTAQHDLDDTFEHGGTLSVRWLLCHLIEEYARHNGHADLLREVLDGSTGE